MKKIQLGKHYTKTSMFTVNKTPVKKWWLVSKITLGKKIQTFGLFSYHGIHMNFITISPILRFACGEMQMYSTDTIIFRVAGIP